VLLLHMPWVPP